MNENIKDSRGFLRQMTGLVDLGMKKFETYLEHKQREVMGEGSQFHYRS